MDFLTTIAGEIVKPAWVAISRHFGYLICYKNSIEKLVSKFNELDDLRKDVQGKIDAARRERLEEVNSVVQTWLGKVDEMKEEVEKIKDQATVIPNNCFLHINLHYKLGREAAHHMETTDDLISGGRNFDSVSHKRPPPSTTDSLLFNEDYVIFDSRKSQEKKILEALKDEAVRLIAVWGMGGGGKTTLVREVAKQAKEQSSFGEVVMVTVSQNIDLKSIQTDMAVILGLKLGEDNLDVRAGQLAERLKTTQNKVLVILDDLWEMLDLSKVGIRRPQMGTTCKVVITTRNKDVCERMRCQEIVELKTLTDEESWRLFRSRAGDAVESPTIRKLARKVARECAGLPLALVVLGTALQGKSSEIWEAVFMRLKKSEVDLPGVSKQVFQSIQLSFDFLESEAAKSCFLHCCLYPEDRNIRKEDLMHMMVGGGLLADVETLNEAQNRVDLLVDQLKACGLLLQGRVEGCVGMHDVVRDVAIQISAKDHMFYVRAGRSLAEWPRTTQSETRNWRRFSLMYNDIEDLPPDPMVYPELETLILSHNDRLSSIPEMFFLHMGSLMVLDLSSTGIKSLPKSVSCLTNLRVLNLRDCFSLNDISHINGLKRLEIFILERCPVSIAPEGVEWAQNVRFVDFGWFRPSSLDDYFSKELPRFRRLEKLFMNKFAGSFRELRSLRHLTHLFIQEPVDLDDPLPHELVSTASWSDRLLKFSLSLVEGQPWKWVHFTDDTRCLKLMGTKPLPDWVERLLKRTIQLALVNFQETELISIKWLSLSSLVSLEVVNWPNLTKLLGDELLLHEQFSPSQLEEMIISNCPRLTSLIPSSLWQKLKHLSVTDCPMLLELFPCDHKAHDKTELNGLQQLHNVLQPFQCLPNLTCLEIDNCGVRYVVSSEMETVAILADPFPALEELWIENCQEMSAMISPGASLQALFFFQGLRSLTIESCPRLTHLFSYKQAISMQHLSKLYIGQCGALEAVVISTENKEEASASTSTHAVDCGSYNNLFPNLTSLWLFDLPQLTAFHHPAALPVDWLYIKSSHIENCPKLQHPLFGDCTPAYEQKVWTSIPKYDVLSIPEYDVEGEREEEEGDDAEGEDLAELREPERDPPAKRSNRAKARPRHQNLATWLLPSPKRHHVDSRGKAEGILVLLLSSCRLLYHLPGQSMPSLLP